jgi:V/A-type H+/Na+-transporting ATPase subunit K
MADVGTIGQIFLNNDGAIAIAAGLAMGISALAAAWSQGSMGSAAMGTVAERPELESKMIVYIVLPEILALFGFVVAFLLLSKIGGE